MPRMHTYRCVPALQLQVYYRYSYVLKGLCACMYVDMYICRDLYTTVCVCIYIYLAVYAIYTQKYVLKQVPSAI